MFRYATITAMMAMAACGDAGQPVQPTPPKQYQKQTCRIGAHRWRFQAGYDAPSCEQIQVATSCWMMVVQRSEEPVASYSDVQRVMGTPLDITWGEQPWDPVQKTHVAGLVWPNGRMELWAAWKVEMSSYYHELTHLLIGVQAGTFAEMDSNHEKRDIWRISEEKAMAECVEMALED